jgi:hypothetical protein
MCGPLGACSARRSARRSAPADYSPSPQLVCRRRRPAAAAALHLCAGSAFWLGISTFGVLFLGLLAQLIKRGYPYAGEWFEAGPGEPGEPALPLEEQRAAAVAGLVSAVWMYFGVALLSGAMVCYHRVRRR